ncbi:Nucleoporin [Apiospora kogelbergensis]|uniref:Nucleoporin n=1 Tax=Apiospora kogelbergensis TaxID=1337665 RepID=A0AAW0QFP7_9PEZI
MAPQAVDKVYLPDLESCLKGETVILSWRLLAAALSDTTGHRQGSKAVVEFLTNPQVQTLFTKPNTVFEAGDNDSYKQAFETRTSAVQVAPTPNDKYDVKTIKEDSVWLSKNARINLLAALRVVVIEFQSRARSQLVGAISSQDAVSLQEAAGATNAQTSTVIPGLNLSGLPDAADLESDFEKPESRRLRIFSTYLTERRHFAMSTDYIFTLMLQQRLPSLQTATEATTRIRDSFLDAYGLTSLAPQSDAPAKTYHALVSRYFTVVSDSIAACGDITTVTEDKALHRDDMQIERMQTFVTEAIHAMTVAFQLLDLSSQVLVPAELLQQWFQFLGDTSFLELIGSTQGLGELNQPAQCLVCMISLSIFNLPRIIKSFAGDVDIDPNTEYIGSSDALELVHQVAIAGAERNITPAIPVAFAWVPILHGMWASYQERAERRDALQNQKAIETYDSGTQMIPGSGRRNSAGSITTIDKTGYDDFLANTQLDREIQPAHMLAAATTDQGLVYAIISSMAVFLGTSEEACFAVPVGSRMRIVLLDLLTSTFPYIGYRGESVGALLSVLSGGEFDYWTACQPATILPEQNITVRALQDPAFLNNYFMQAVNRFPLEFVPFISLSRILACAPNTAGEVSELIGQILQKGETLTFELPDDFNAYQLAHEEDNSNTICLIEDLPLFAATSNRRLTSAEEESFVIPAGSLGRFVVDEGRTVQIDYSHSILALLGKRLEANLTPSIYQQELGALSVSDTTYAITMLATLVKSEFSEVAKGTSTAGNHEAGLAILAEASRSLPRNKDIVSVVCETLDVHLEGEPDQSILSVLAACLQFLDAALPLCPGRVWSYMSRCTLLATESRVGKLSRLIGSLEMSRQRFDFLMSAVRVFSSLVETSMSSSVQRKTTIKSHNRQKQVDNPWLGVSDKIVSQITLAISQTAVDILESSSTWRLQSEIQRSILLRDLLPIMNKTILYTFSTDDIASKKTLTAPLQSAAKYIIDSFLAPSAGSLRIQPLLASLVTAVQWPETTVFTNAAKAFTQRTNAVLDLATTLVRVANSVDQSSTTIEQQLFKATPFIAKVGAVNDQFRRSSVVLLEALVVSAGKATGEPPSLLGYLGPQLSRSFLQFLSTLDKPFDQTEEVTVIWRFFSTIVRNRQQWMANCLLTGKTPRDARNGHNKMSKSTPDSVLTRALQRLSHISSISTSEALCVLDFVTSAQNYWPWTIFNLQNHGDFLTALRSYVRNLQPSNTTAKVNAMQACEEARIAAYIAETFAMQLFHLRQMGQANNLAKDLAADLDYFLREGVLVSGYNGALHANFSRNFNKQYPVCILDNFKRTLLEPRSLGTEYYYALTYADKMLQFDAGWIGPRNNGFKSEMERANINLSLVDAQISLFHAWEFLLLELSNCLPQHANLKKQSLQVAEQCLEANQANQGHEQIFERLTDSRVNLALMLVQRVVNNTPSAGDVAQLLTSLWATVSSVEEPYGSENLTLYRTLLKLLYVTLRAQVRALESTSKTAADKKATDSAITTVTQTVLSILDRTVAKGFRTLVSLIHDSDATVFPEDVAILTAIMQACLCIPGINQSQTQIVNIMAAHDAVHVAVSLYSWSDKLAEKGDPVYGELSLLFLLELSALPVVAEQLACDGLLNHITSANLANYLNRPNISPFAETVGPQRCYSIWAKAIVPLLLNVLSALGQTIAPEVGYVLGQFPSLMASSVERFEAPGASRTQAARNSRSSFITTLSTSEIHSLALITRILSALRANNARDIPEVQWDSAGLLENVEFWLGSRKLLRERLVPLGPREAEWKGMKPSDAGKARGCESQLEEKVVNQLEEVRMVLSEGLE